MSGQPKLQQTFSQQVKDEIITSFSQVPEDLYLLLGTVLIVGGRIYNQQIVFSTAQKSLANVLIDTFSGELGVICEVTGGKEQTTLKITDSSDYETVIDFLKDKFSYVLPQGRFRTDWLEADAAQTAGTPVSTRLLQAAFLAGGSLGNPSKSYHLEISVRKLRPALQLQRLLEQQGIEMTLLRRYGYNVLYLKEAEQISDFLALTGAHIALLNFENLRLEKDLRNSVNRVVNCDTANSRRIANAAVRQSMLFRRLQEHEAWDALSEDLQEAARMRINHPDCSLREMGEMMDPPLGKSGMNHRLKKLEGIAHQLGLTEEE